ncbi:DNA polymerase IV [Thermotomaculum hydrothermale]|uniref:DNA-directed DNA polymerase n=1 Tax=Thermotomaculum hydrothermale TaxID=981385 RepID=A0A7R6SXW9_9BACT|nr:DNA polymerase IV [Thermotomaculum hydrothermale]BBB32005.1 DNA polymerase IV [Thermotomaculum hydrothermale]
MLEGIGSIFCHIDMDAFFVSAELRDKPDLRGKPVVVGGGVGDRLGVVASASYEARAYGVKSGMPIFKAKTLCPSLIVLRPHHRDYTRLSAKVIEVMKTVSPDVYQLSIDEALIDLKGVIRIWKSPLRAAHEIITRIKEKLNLPCSAGISRFPKIAKFCAKIAKPHGIVWAIDRHEKEFLREYSVDSMPYFGEATKRFFYSNNVFKIGDVAERFPVFWLKFLLSNPVVNEYPKSISSEVTLDKNTMDRSEVVRILKKLCQKIAKEMRENGFVAREIAVKVRYSDFRNFGANLTKQHLIFDDEIIAKSLILFKQADCLPLSIRLVGVRLSNFVKEESLLLLPSPSEYRKKSNLFKTIDSLRDKYGLSSIYFG